MVLKSTDATDILVKLEKDLRNELLKTWKEQGHLMTGKIVESADFVARTTANHLEFLLYIYPYGGYIETGVPAERIPYSPGSGKKKSKYIEALIGYAEKKLGLAGKEAKSAAFAIAMKQKQEGMPTRGSYRFTSTGKRTEWLQDTFDRNRNRIERAMFAYVDRIFSGKFENMITKYSQLMSVQ